MDDRGGAKAKASAGHYPTRLAAMIPQSVLTRLDSADVAFSGTGGITVGIELKKVTDALSCMYTGRLADTQLPAMADAYDVRYLVIEELYRAEPATGVLQYYRGEFGRWGHWQDAHAGRRRMMYQSFELWLHTLSEQGRARLEKTADIQATASLIQALYTWWNRNGHDSFKVMQEPQGQSAELARPTRLRRMAAQLPLIGWERSKAVVERFRSLSEMVSAPESAWLEIDGIGKGIAQKVTQFIHGDDHAV